MFKLDFSDLQESGYKINQLRLFHTSKIRGKNLMKNKTIFLNKEDLTGERNLILEYITEKMEICYTTYLLFAGLMFLSASILILTLLIPELGSKVAVVSGISTFVCWFIANKNKGDFVMGSVGYGLAETMYNFKIKEKYNL